MAVPWGKAHTSAWSSEDPERAFGSFTWRSCLLWGSDEGWLSLPALRRAIPTLCCVWGSFLLIEGLLPFLLSLPTVPCPSLTSLSSCPAFPPALYCVCWTGWVKFPSQPCGIMAHMTPDSAEPFAPCPVLALLMALLALRTTESLGTLPWRQQRGDAGAGVSQLPAQGMV